MKFTDLQNNRKVRLLQELVYLTDDAKGQEYRYLTRAELEKMIQVVYPAGTMFTYDASQEVLTCPDGDIGLDTDADIDPTIYEVLPMTMDKQTFQLISELIDAGLYRVQDMYIKSGALRGDAIVTHFGDKTHIGFEFELTEPPEGTFPLDMVLEYMRQGINAAVLHAFHIMAFIDAEHDAPTPLAAEFPDLSKPITDQLLGVPMLGRPTPVPDPQ